MARIYDNIETKFTEGLQGIITNVGAKRVDFCVGCFNLRVATTCCNKFYSECRMTLFKTINYYISDVPRKKSVIY